MLLVGTNVGVTLVNVRTREVITALSFNHIFQQPKTNRLPSFLRTHGQSKGIEDKNDGIFGSMISQLIFGSDQEASDNESIGLQKNKTCHSQDLIIMGQRTSDAKTFALSIIVQKNSKSSKIDCRNKILSTNRECSAKGQSEFSVIAQTPAKRGSLFENMQRKYAIMNSTNSNGNKNPTSILHGKSKGNSRKMKSSISVPNLDKSEIKEDEPSVADVPKLVENYNKTVKGRKSSDPKTNNNINNMIRKTKSSGYGKIYEKIKMFEPNLNSPGKKRSSSTSQTRKKNSMRENHYYNPYHGHKAPLHRNSQPEAEISNHKGNESNDG